MKHPLLITLVIYFSGLGAAGQFSKLAVSFVALSDIYGGHDATLGFAVSLISLVGVVLGLIAGMVVNRIGTRRALVWALGLGAVISFWQSSLPSLPFLMISRVIEGTSHLLIVVAAPTLIAEMTPDRFRPAALTLWSTFFGVAFALTAFVAPRMIEFGGLETLILTHGIWMATAAGLCALLLPKQQNDDVSSRLTRSIFARHVKAYATPGIATPALGWLCYTLTFVSVLTTMPLLTQELAPAWLAPSAPLLSIAVALTAGIYLLSRLRAWNVVMGGFVVCLAAAIFMFVSEYSSISLLAMFAAMSFVQGSGFAMVPQLNHDPNTRALANGAMAQMGNSGNLIGTPLLIAIYHGAPMVGPFLFLAAAYTIGLVVTWHLGRRALAIPD